MASLTEPQSLANDFFSDPHHFTTHNCDIVSENENLFSSPNNISLPSKINKRTGIKSANSEAFEGKGKQTERGAAKSEVLEVKAKQSDRFAYEKKGRQVHVKPKAKENVVPNQCR